MVRGGGNGDAGRKAGQSGRTADLQRSRGRRREPYNPGVSIDPRRIEVIDDKTAEILRAKTGAERLAIASEMAASVRSMMAAHLRAVHPTWTDEQLQAEMRRRLNSAA